MALRLQEATIAQGLVALVAAIVMESAFTVISSVIIGGADEGGRPGKYGAPLYVGTSTVSLLNVDQTFSKPVFVINVAITSLVFLALTIWAGLGGALIGLTASLVFVGLYVYAFAANASHQPFPYLVLPIPPSPFLPGSLTFWIDMLLWAAGAAGLWRFWRRAPRRSDRGASTRP